MATTKKYYTRAEILRKIEMEGDLEGEDFVQLPELQGYIDEAINETEKMVHSLYEDYFLTYAPISVVKGQENYALPEDIYAHKIRSIFFNDGGGAPTECTRVRDWRKLGRYTDDRYNSTGDGREFSYFLKNTDPGIPEIILTPIPGRVGTITVWYLRNANRLEEDTDILDIPEGLTFICQYVRTRCYEKEGHPMLQKAVGDLGVLKDQLEGILRDMVPDNNTELEMDTSIYGEMS